MGRSSAFGKQFKRADRCGARWALVLGDDEAERGEVRLKPLQQQGEEATVAISADRRDRGGAAHSLRCGSISSPAVPAFWAPI